MKIYPKIPFFDVILTSGFTPKIILSLIFCLLMLFNAKGEKIDNSHLRAAEDTAPLSDCSITAVCVADLNISLDQFGNATLVPEDIDAGSYSDCGEITLSVSPSTFDCDDVGNTIVVFLTVTDEEGNTNQCWTNVLVEDKFAPSVTCYGQVNVSLGISGNVTLIPEMIVAEASDNCELTYDISPSNFDCFDVGNNIPVLVTVTDAGGNANQCWTNVLIEDKLAPTAICHAQVNISLGVDGTATITPAVIDAGSSDNCGPLTFSLSQSTFDCSDIGDSITVLLTVTDGSGNSNVCWTDIVVEDKTPLDITWPSDINLPCNANTDPSVTGEPIVTDNCDNYGIAYQDQVFNLAGNAIKILRTWSVVDWITGNVVSHIQIIKTIDTAPPVAICVANVNISLDQFGNAILVPEAIDANSYDDCGDVTLSVSPSAFDCNDIGNTITVVLTVTDESGNTAQCTSNVLVEDKLAPTAICNAQVNLSLGADGTATITPDVIDADSYDNCGDVTLALSQSTFDCTDIGDSITVLLTVTDGSGNTNVCWTTIVVEDKLAPMVTCPPDLTLDCADGDNLDPSITGYPIVEDNCDAIGYAYEDLVIELGGPNFKVLREWIVVDWYSQTFDTCFQIIKVFDTTPPDITCVNQLTAALDNSGSLNIVAEEFILASSDDCGTFTLELSQTEFDCSNLGDNNLIITAYDESGNQSQCFVVLTIVDLKSPIAFCNAQVNISLGQDGTATITPEIIDAGSYDECGPVTLSLSQSSFDCADIGDSIIVILTVTDESGNTNECWTEVVVEDKLAPMVTCPPDLTLDCADGDNLDPSITGYPIVEDNCDAIGFAYEDLVIELGGPNFKVLREWIVVDWYSQTFDTCFQIIKVFDTTPPDITCVNQLTAALDNSGSLNIVAEEFILASSDDCGTFTLELSQTEFDCSNLGDNNLIITAYDESGNQSQCFVVLTIVDLKSPIAFCNAQVNISLGQDGTATITPEIIDAGSYDECGPVTLSLSQSSFDCADIGDSIIVILTVTDESGNTNECWTEVVVEDKLAPMVTCPPDLTLDCADGDNLDPSITGYPIVEDNCDAIGFAYEDLVIELGGPNFKVLREWIVVDWYSQTFDTCFQIIKVFDTTPPDILCVNQLTAVLDNTGSLTLFAEDFDAGTTDDCGIVTLSLFQNEFDCSDIGDTTVIINATDESGNQSQCIANLTIVDNTSPTAVCNAQINISLGADGTATITPDVIDAGSSDECGSVSLSLDQYTFDCADIGDSIIVILTVTDESGNTNECWTEVVVEDKLAPIVTCPADITLDCSEGDNLDPDITGYPVVVDNCDFIGTAYDDLVLQLGGPNFKVLRTWIVVDFYSNTTDTCSQIIKVFDTTPPDIICVNQLTVTLDETGSLTLSAQDFDAGTTDDCGIVTLSISQDQFNCSDIGNTTITLTATDDSGNQSQCISDLTIVGLDADGDGFSICNGDCDDNDESTYPNAPEICGDNIDNNCNGEVDEDCICPSYGQSTQNEWIESISAGGTANNTGDDGGYGDYSSIILNLNQGSNALEVTPGFSGGKRKEAWRVWIDLNQNGVYENSEKVFEDISKNPIVSTFDIPLTAQLGITSMRVSMKFNQYAEPCEIFAEGEVEDYTVNISGTSFCTAQGQSTLYEWINKVKIKSINNQSGDDNGYGDYTSLSTNLNPGQNKNINLNPGFSGGSYLEYWRVWVDWNEDGDFEDAGELEVEVSSSGNVTDQITVPANASGGNKLMRVSMKYGGYPDPCETFTYGEVEDYTLFITGSNPLVGNVVLNNLISTKEAPSANIADDIIYTRAQGRKLEVNIFPNPTSNYINLQMESPNTGEWKITLYNKIGQKVYQTSTNQNRLVIDATQPIFTNGLYLIQIKQGNEVTSKRIIIAR